MQKEFKAEDLVRLKELFTEFSFSGSTLEGKFGANSLNPFDLLNSTSITSLDVLYEQIQKSLENSKGKSRWRLTDAQLKTQEKFTLWAEFLDLLIGYRLDKETKESELAAKRKKARELDARIAEQVDKGKTLDDLKKEREALGV